MTWTTHAYIVNLQNPELIETIMKSKMIMIKKLTDII